MIFEHHDKKVENKERGFPAIVVFQTGVE